MLFHLLRFSFFLLVHLIGFAVTFEALFKDCEDELGYSFRDFGASILTLFGAMLGGADFTIFDDEICEHGMYWASEVGVFLLVMYLLVMAILMLNLLIAVLGTIHDEVRVYMRSFCLCCFHGG